MSFSRAKRLVPILALSLLSLSAPALAQATTEQPVATTATYRDWTLRCDNVASEPPRKVCEVAQAIRSPDGQNVLGQVVVGRPAPDKPIKLIVQLPPGVWLPANVTISAEDAPIVTATYKSCGQLCFADIDLDDATVALLRERADPVQLVFQDGTQRAIALPVSLAGFAAALDASAAAISQ